MSKNIIVTFSASVEKLTAALERTTEAIERLGITLEGERSPLWWSHFGRQLRRRTSARLAAC